MEAKICINCGKTKSLISFASNKKKDGTISYASKCRSCSTGTTPLNSPFFDESKNQRVKLCKHCQQIKPVDEFKKGKYIGNCKNCTNEQNKISYAQKSPEEKKLKAKIYGAKQRENKEIYNAKRREYYAKPEVKKRLLEAQRKRYKSCAGQKTKERYLKYKESIKKGMAAYQARKKGASVVVRFTKADIIKRDGLNCYLCDKLLTEKTATVDHLIPLSRGGNHKPENAKIACQPCNSSKHTKTLAEYKKWRGDYDRFKIKSRAATLTASPY